MKHLLKLLDLSGEEIISILNLADQLKYENKHHIPHPLLAGKTLGMIFEKASTRTRVSFEVGMNQLGGTQMCIRDSVSIENKAMWRLNSLSRRKGGKN